MRKFATAALLAASMFGSTAAYADGGLSFFITGDTFNQPYTITNTSTAGEKVVAFGFTLRPGLVFDTLNPPPGLPNATPFTPIDGTEATVGLVGSPVVADGATSFMISFTDFDFGESFKFLIDVDPDVAPNIFIYGSTLIGSSIFADFSNGLRGSGFLEAVPGDPLASRFVITTITPTPGVPEPATWAMMLGGFGMVGFALRRRNQSVRVTYA